MHLVPAHHPVARPTLFVGLPHLFTSLTMALAAKATCTLPSYSGPSLASTLRGHKRHNLGVIAGTGTSALMSQSSAQWLMAHADVWALNQFFLHEHLIPRFYNLEMRFLATEKKALKKESNAQYWKRYFVGQNRSAYRDSELPRVERTAPLTAALLTMCLRFAT